MTKPTRIIEDDEFNRIMGAEDGDDLIILHALVAMKWDYNKEGELITRKGRTVYVLFVNVAEPVIYKDKSTNRTIVLANAYEDWDYDLISDLHIIDDADMYYVVINGVDFDDTDYSLDLFTFFFKDEDKKFGKVDIENVLPVNERGLVH